VAPDGGYIPPGNEWRLVSPYLMCGHSSVVRLLASPQKGCQGRITKGIKMDGQKGVMSAAICDVLSQGFVTGGDKTNALLCAYQRQPAKRTAQQRLRDLPGRETSVTATDFIRETETRRGCEPVEAMPKCLYQLATIPSLSYHHHHHHHHICHAVGPPVDPFRSHVSRSLFKGLP